MNRTDSAQNRPQLVISPNCGIMYHYISQVFSDHEIIPLADAEGVNTPSLLVYCPPAESVEALSAEAVADYIVSHSPEAVVMISSVSVYGKEEGEMVDESSPTWPSPGAASVMLEAERRLRKACDAKGVNLLILRPVMMFGAEVEGEAARMFAAVVSGRYLHVRGNDARISIVTALDVARAARALAHTDGIYNVADGRPCTRRQLAEAMSANAGRHHRMSTLPLKWAGALSPLALIVPALRPMFGRDALRRSMLTLTFSADKLSGAAGLKMYDTLEVIARTAADYPYEEE